jgi:uncharacterized protein YcbK (DUF882 family)
MHPLHAKNVVAAAIAAAFLVASPGYANAKAAAHHNTRAHVKHFYTAKLASARAAYKTRSHRYATQMAAAGDALMLHLHHLHTGETLNIVYKIGNEYVPGAIDKLNYFLRDHRTNEVSTYDPREFDLLHSVMSRLGRPNGVVDIVCGYRSPETNEYLRTRSEDSGVARNSQHVLAKAIDIRVPGVRTRRLRDAALSLKEGGVGYYPVSKFVHVDVGPVREWTYRGSGD